MNSAGLDHVASWYAATATVPALRPALAGDVDCDVCVIGGGIAGCSTALHLAAKGYKVVLLEAHRIGWGASGRSGAQAIFGVSCGEQKIEQLLGKDDARKVFDLTVEGLQLLRESIERHGMDCDWVAGQMHVAVKPRQIDELRQWRDSLARDYDYPNLEFLDRNAVREVIASNRYLAGLLDRNSGHLHPLKYTLGLAGAAERAGATIHEGSRALDWRGGTTVTVTTAKGSVRCRFLVFCGNAYLGDLAPQLKRKIMNVGTYIVATEPLPQERATALIRNNAAVTDINWVLDYFRRSADHRLLFGGRVSYSGLDPLGTREATRRRMLNVFPQLQDLKIDYAWGGYVDISLNRAPHFGRLAPNVLFMQGFSGHGIVLTGMGGKLVAETIAGTAERFDVLARIAHKDFPGGMLLRRPALVLAMLYYRLRDML
ncbi:MAG: FAD-binding oxidoreductase [Steroidobacteraceae bacterium]